MQNIISNTDLIWSHSRHRINLAKFYNLKNIVKFIAVLRISSHFAEKYLTQLMRSLCKKRMPLYQKRCAGREIKFRERIARPVSFHINEMRLVVNKSYSRIGSRDVRVWSWDAIIFDIEPRRCNCARLSVRLPARARLFTRDWFIIGFVIMRQTSSRLAGVTATLAGANVVSDGARSSVKGCILSPLTHSAKNFWVCTDNTTRLPKIIFIWHIPYLSSPYVFA